MAFLQLPPPSAFSILQDPHTVSTRWEEWASTLKRYIAATGINSESQKCQILLYTAGKEVCDVHKGLENRPKDDKLDDLITALGDGTSEAVTT